MTTRSPVAVIERARAVAARRARWRRTGEDPLSSDEEEFVRWAMGWDPSRLPMCLWCRKRCCSSLEEAEHQVAFLVLSEDCRGGTDIRAYECAPGIWHAGHARRHSEPPEVSGRPSEKFSELVRMARDVAEAGGPRDDRERQVERWAEEWPRNSEVVRECPHCGSKMHSTHVGAAQHAAFLVLRRGAGRLRCYRCPESDSLHVGRR